MNVGLKVLSFRCFGVRYVVAPSWRSFAFFVDSFFVSFLAIYTFTWLTKVSRALAGGSLRVVSRQAGRGGGGGRRVGE